MSVPTLGRRIPRPSPAGTLRRPVPASSPLRAPAVSPVSNISKIATKAPAPAVSYKPPATLGRRIDRPASPPTLGRRIDRPAPTGGAGSQSAPGPSLGKPKKDISPPADAPASDEGYSDALPSEPVEEVYEPEIVQADEQAYYEQSALAEAAAQNIHMNNSPIMTRTVWQRIKDWFADIFAGEEGITAPITSAHIRDNVMHVASIVFNADGYHYIVTRIPCSAARGKNGSVNFGNENPRWLQGAIHQAKHRIQAQAERVADDRCIAEVIERARAGDQNAYALIAMVRTNAQAGNPRAIASERAMRNYISKHPAQATMAGELGQQNRAKQMRAALVFANGRPIHSEVISGLGSQFGAEEHAFYAGARSFNKNVPLHIARSADPARLQAYEIGQVIGKARALQLLRAKRAPISHYSPIIGWELGE